MTVEYSYTCYHLPLETLESRSAEYPLQWSFCQCPMAALLPFLLSSWPSLPQLGFPGPPDRSRNLCTDLFYCFIKKPFLVLRRWFICFRVLQFTALPLENSIILSTYFIFTTFLKKILQFCHSVFTWEIHLTSAKIACYICKIFEHMQKIRSVPNSIP